LSDADASPVVQTAFARARDRRTDSARVALTARLRSEPGALFVGATIVDPEGAVHRIVLSFRHAGNAEYSRLTLRRDGARAEATAPIVSGAEGRAVQYYLEAQAPSGAVLATAATAEQPLAARVPSVATAEPRSARAVSLPARDEADEEDGTILESPWFWTAAAAVVGGAVAGYVALAPSDDGPEAGTLGQGALE
jgi:hypothetical protein